MEAKGHTKIRRTILGLTILSITGWNLSPLRRPPAFHARGIQRATQFDRLENPESSAPTFRSRSSPTAAKPPTR